MQPVIVLLRKLLFVLSLAVVLLASFSYAASPISCHFDSSGICNDDEEALFYASRTFYDPVQDVILSSDIHVTSPSLAYSIPLCCDTLGGSIDYQSLLASQNCEAANITYLTSDESARSAVRAVRDLHPSYYSHRLCIDPDKTYSEYSFAVSDNDDIYTAFGFQCLFRLSAEVNAVVSSCNATFNGGNQYPLAVWARTWYGADALDCNVDCTSKLDDRVYSDCGAKIPECRNVPLSCDGSLLGSWVPFAGDKEFLCSPPWNVTRELAFTNEKLDVQINSTENCDNIVVKEYKVLINNEAVTMKVYVCSEN